MSLAISLKEVRYSTILILLGLALMAVFFLALGAGQVAIPLKDTLLILMSKIGLASYTPDTVYET
ncbi:MAG TPA: hypothetical protein VG737_14585, partial [Cyclobacteriaceae bacterium]|nr:hypothetical protein [Cyclobacteriaceae bacterium]